MKIKKIVSIVSVISILLLGEITPFKVNAVTYDSRDINRDGCFDVLDLVLHGSYLNGKKYTSLNSVLDVDGNSIVSSVDQQCITSGIADLDFVNRVKGNSTAFTAHTTSMTPTAEGRFWEYYACHNYTHNFDSNYSLTLADSAPYSALSSNTISPYSIIGPDNREPDAISGIVRLSSGGTGFVVGDHVIATAAHCVYNRNDKKWVSNLCVYLPDENGISTTTPINAIEAHIPYNYMSKDYSECDYALISVSEDLSDQYHFSLGIPYNVYSSSDFKRYIIYTTGYSQSNPDDETPNFSNQMYTGNGKIIAQSNTGEKLLHYDADTTGGNSGGPVYVKEYYGNDSGEKKEQITVIGVHTTGATNENRGVMMNATMLTFYLNNGHITYQ